MSRGLCAAAVLTLVVVVAGPKVSAQRGRTAPDPFVGTWILDAQQSHFKPTVYLSSKMTIDAVGDKGLQRKFTVETTLASGQSVQYDFTAAYDGQPYPLKLINADSVVLRRVDARTLERSYKRGETLDTLLVSTLSPDGKTMTVTQKGHNPQGQEVDNLLVYLRQ